MPNVYLDHAATTPLSPAVREAMRPYLAEDFGNPSSRHPLGVRAAKALDKAREQLAKALLVPARQIVFTSGGTEACNLAVLGFARALRSQGRHVVVGPTEHPCVRESAAALAREGFEVETARLDARGELDLDDFARRLRADTVVVAQMLANNEVGTIYPVQRVAQLVRARAPRAKLVVDAVQAFGKLDCALPELGADALALSAHKIHGPKGAGALAFAAEPRLEPLAYGGGQELGLRPGTPNVAAIAGLGQAAEIAERSRPMMTERMQALRARLCEFVAEIPGARVLAPGVAVLPSIVAVLIPGAPAEVLLHHLEERGAYVGTGSACQAAKKELSPTLLALGLSADEAVRVLRISFAALTVPEEVEQVGRALVDVARELKAVHG